MNWSRPVIRPVCLHLTHFTAALALGMLISAAVGPKTCAQQVAVNKLIVGTRHAPPFATHNEDGTRRSISAELWRHIADELNSGYELQECGLKELQNGLEDGTLDAAVALLAVTAEREGRVDDHSQADHEPEDRVALSEPCDQPCNSDGERWAPTALTP